MNNLNSWSGGVILACIAGGLAAVFIFFLLYDSYRIKKRITRYGRVDRSGQQGSSAGVLSVARSYSGSTTDEMKARAERKEALLELQRRYEHSFNQLAQRQQEIENRISRIPRDETTEATK